MVKGESLEGLFEVSERTIYAGRDFMINRLDAPKVE
jgi:hypothetical protein